MTERMKCALLANKTPQTHTSKGAECSLYISKQQRKSKTQKNNISSHFCSISGIYGAIQWNSQLSIVQDFWLRCIISFRTNILDRISFSANFRKSFFNRVTSQHKYSCRYKLYPPPHKLSIALLPVENCVGYST